MSENRAYSLMKVKAVNEDARTITGIASTPSADRYGDVMEPKGAQFKLPLPLLWQHDPLQPVGTITKARITDEGIEITAQVAKADPDAPSQLAARLGEAWTSIKSGLVRGLSIGFRPIEYSYIDGGGVHYSQWDLMEVSAVTIPANAECNIQTIKSFSNGNSAALGNKTPEDKKTIAGVSAKKSFIKENKPMNIAESIKAFETKRATLNAERVDLMAKAGDEGVTLDLEAGQKYDDVTAEIKSVDQHLARLRDMQAIDAQTAKPAVSTVETKGVETRAPGIIKVEKPLEKGIAFARFAKSLAAAKGSRSEALSIAKHSYPEDAKLHHVLKAAVNAGTTSDPKWAGSLVEYQEFTNDFVEFLRPQTIIGRFGSNGIPSLRQVPFNVRIPAQIGGGGAAWVGEGVAKPLTNFEFSTIEFSWAKVAAISVLTDELVRFSNPAADALVRNALAEAVIARLDTDFIDPKKVAEAKVSPASITNGIKGAVSTGDVEKDIEAAFAQFINANLSPANGVWIMSANLALYLSMYRNPLGQKQYPEMTLLGGTLAGLPVIVSQYVGDQLILVNASDIYLADDGQVVIDASRETSLEMMGLDKTSGANTTVGNSGKGTGATTMVSMFQTNSVAIRAERWINWQRRRDAAVARITGLKYGANTTT
ncbi:phage major capsid protein [Enterobacter huaxiensis]|uniref:phage major capsid protein n=1 Tax=Enterobacter huaxiensis TaxID=2494702 RepID=UPI002175CEFC|nr:phage major capsid protein [Enterobacter huaxiensis]MCS5452505.1 phage major capsid protein [Enterobacter huaxiensis]